MVDLNPILTLLAETRPAVLAEVASMSAADFARAPRPGQWSAAQNLDHLALLEARLVSHFRAMVAGTQPSTVSAFDRWRCLPPQLVRWRGISIRNPRVVAPADQAQPREELLDRLARSRADLLAFVEETRSRDLSNHRLVHKALGGMNLYGWFAMIAHHEERHRRQIVALKRDLARAS